MLKAFSLKYLLLPLNKISNGDNVKVFLGGTMNNSRWREKIIPNLKIDYFNPMVRVWDENAQLNEAEEKKNCDILLFVITPLMTGSYSIAEVTDASNKTPEKTVLCILNEDAGKKWSPFQEKSLSAVKNLVQENGGTILNSLEDVTSYLNKKK